MNPYDASAAIIGTVVGLVISAALYWTFYL